MEGLRHCGDDGCGGAPGSRALLRCCQAANSNSIFSSPTIRPAENSDRPASTAMGTAWGSTLSIHSISFMQTRPEAALFLHAKRCRPATVPANAGHAGKTAFQRASRGRAEATAGGVALILYNRRLR